VLDVEPAQQGTQRQPRGTVGAEVGKERTTQTTLLRRRRRRRCAVAQWASDTRGFGDKSGVTVEQRRGEQAKEMLGRGRTEPELLGDRAQQTSRGPHPERCPHPLLEDQQRSRGPGARTDTGAPGTPGVVVLGLPDRTET